MKNKSSFQRNAILLPKSKYNQKIICDQIDLNQKILNQRQLSIGLGWISLITLSFSLQQKPFLCSCFSVCSVLSENLFIVATKKAFGYLGIFPRLKQQQEYILDNNSKKKYEKG